MDPSIDPSTGTPWAKHEKDPRWTAVDHFAISHLQPATTPLSKALAYAAQLSNDAGLPDIAVSALQGQFLQLQCRLLGVKHVLEVGTLGGLSTIWLLSASPDVRVTTVEINEKHAATARQAIEKAGMADRVDILLGPAAHVLVGLRDDVQAGKRPRFDFAFIDADKPGNKTYFNLTVPMCAPGACLIVDNVVRRGEIADDELTKKDLRLQGARDVIIAAGQDDRVDATLMQTVGEKNYDGMLICMVK